MTGLLGTPDAMTPLPRVGSEIIDAIERSRLVGRGGAGFPVATKWRAVAQRSHGNAVIVVNGAEGEPQSKKDRVLMSERPHLVLDGAFIAARALRARHVILYIGERHDAARSAMLRALSARPEPERGGGATEAPRAILVGGYFGSWVEPEQAWNLELNPDSLRRNGLGLGCGVIGLLPASRCPVCETAGIMRYLAGESSAQCGPCFFGLRALADACTRVAERGSNPEDLKRLQRWAIDVRGRGACRHPDGAVMFLSSSLQVFGQEFASHRSHHVSRTA